MKTIFPLLKSLSRTVHAEQSDEQQLEHSETGDGGHRWKEEPMDEGGADVRPGPCNLLTVWRKSLLLSCNGFTVIDSSGNLVYRVDNYARHHPREMVLMDGTGRPVLTVRLHKKPGIPGSWVIYEGEAGDDIDKSGKKPLCSVRKHINVLRNAKPKILATVSSRHPDSLGSTRRQHFVIKGSYVSRSCKVVEEETGEVVAEVRRKEETIRGVSFGFEVFVLVVHPGFNAGLAMALVVLLDQMFS